VSDGLTVRVNLPQFRRELRDLGAKVEKRVVAAGVRAAGVVFRDAARALAPRLKKFDRRRSPGALAAAVRLAQSRRGRRGTVAYFVGVKASASAKGRGRDPFYWRFLEAGWIPRGRGQKLRGGVNSRNLQRRRLVAAGASRVQVPFLAPAFARRQGAALAAFNAKVDERLAQLESLPL